MDTWANKDLVDKAWSEFVADERVKNALIDENAYWCSNRHRRYVIERRAEDAGTRTLPISD